MIHAEPPGELIRTFARNGLILDQSQVELLVKFVDGVRQWNSKINLISRRDLENIWFSHVLHSLSLLFYVEIPDGYRVLDLGTGGGFPGIPLAVARPSGQFVLVDSIRKKTTAVQDIVGRMALSNVRVLTGRAEEIYRQLPEAGTFDLVLARAVASLRDLVRWARPYLKEPSVSPEETPAKGKRLLAGPALVALKGGNLEGEIAEARIKEALRSVRVIRLSFDGSAELGVNDKQAVIAHL